MTFEASARTPRAALALVAIVALLVLLQLGAVISQVLADIGGGAASTTVTPDPLSDEVAATAAEFRVDESGAATYSIPLYAVPGTAGVAPKLSLNYSSQGGYGPLGKGWTIGGLSSISRCRATREAGDFIVAGVATDGNPAPINYAATDRYCLDGQRLIPAQTGSATCQAISGMTAANLRTEIESFQRVCAYTLSGGASGPAFFTVDRKDGSSSWYGDRDNDASANRADGYFNSTVPGKEAFALLWAQTRFQDSTGNYIDFLYHENLDGVVGEHLISEVRFTGKTVLSGQAGSAQTPYAKLVFNYALRGAAAQSKGYHGGGVLTQAHSLYGVTSCSTADACYVAYQARYYQLTYAASPSGNGLDTLASVQECRDGTKEVCLPATTFDWSQARHEFDALAGETAGLPNGSLSKFEGLKFGDLDGDGRQDIVWIKDGVGGDCSTESVNVSYARLDAAGKIYYHYAGGMCVPAEFVGGDATDSNWFLLDYDGDGRDDLFINAGTQLRGYRSLSADTFFPYDPSSNLLADIQPIASGGTIENNPQLSDLNGDGLIDLVHFSAGSLRARIMEPGGSTGYRWGNERPVLIQGMDSAPLGSFQKDNFQQLSDFNGDARSDLLVHFPNAGGCGVPPEPPPPVPPGPPAQPASTASGTTTSSISCSIVHAMVVESVADDRVVIKPYGGINNGEIGNLQNTSLTVADINGDGLTDFFLRSEAYNWVGKYINYGDRFSNAYEGSISVGTVSNIKHLQFADINGDGRTDVVYPGANPREMAARQALPDGNFGQERILYGRDTGCEDSDCLDQRAFLLGDYDGDGGVDFGRISWKDGTSPIKFWHSAQRGKPRDVIVRITNGLGAKTEIGYQPLTNSVLYRRDYASRNTLAQSWGRGAPVQDLLAPMYVVAQASSSSPQAGNASAMASLYYRYAGAKVQAGGRGFLGFRTIETIDPNQSGGYVVTATTYNQNFPYVGMPSRTVKSAVVGQGYAAPGCVIDLINNACFMAPGQPHPSLGGSWFSDSSQIWEADTEIAGAATTAFAAGAQAPVHVRTAGSDESLRDPIGGATTSRVVTTFDYGAYGNVTATTVDTYTGASAVTATVITANTYAADNPTAWRLGRLTASTVTHQRPNRPDVVRRASFAYAMTGAATGLLTQERTQPGGDVTEELVKAYTLDAFGNRTRSSTCSTDIAVCGTTALLFHPATATSINRYSRVAYDTRGRYPLATYAPFWDGTGAVEKITQTVKTRNIFGDVTQAYDLNGVDSLAVTGSFGRPYYSWTETVAGSVPGAPAGGIDSTTTYRWCTPMVNGVDCPTGAKFRQKVVTDGAPRQWTWFDLLGRPILKAAETFNIGIGGKDVAAVCTSYDATGKPRQVSNPFFLAGTGGSDGPTGLASVCGSGRAWTTSSYDVLGRPTTVVAPDSSTISNAYNGLQTIATDPRGKTTTQTRNGRGELTQVLDAAGLVTRYYHLADGSMYYVTRDAGRGAVGNSFNFDALGRKFVQTDPDSGTSSYEYNALGELTAQIQPGLERIEHEYDARGRLWRKTVKQADGTVESQSTYAFDTAANGLGQLASETITGQYAAWTGQAGTSLDFTRSYSYDTLGRPLGSTTGIDGVNYGAATQYDSLGRPWKAQDASGRWSKTVFNARGLASAVCNSTINDTWTGCPPTHPDTYVTTLETDAWGHTVKERRGGSTAMEVTRDYWTDTGRTATICAGPLEVGTNRCKLLDEGYGWDAAGNLRTQTKEGRYVEAFDYDPLNRLIDARLIQEDGITVSKLTQGFEYDALGNLCRKLAPGSIVDYRYGGRAGCGLGGAMNSANGSGGTGTLGPHQVAEAAGVFYAYDGRGNQTGKEAPSATYDRTIGYTIDDRAHEALSGTGVRSRFWYGSDGARYKREDGAKKTLYLGNVEIVTDGGVTTTKRTIAGVMLQTIVGSTATNHYLFHDQLGSLVRIANAAGGVLNSQDYAAFGARRSYDDPRAAGTAPSLTTRGYTGHEHIDGVLNIIHMNGRIFDPALARFLQPDPIIQAPDNAQSWNAYTYCFNNPYRYTDPTGMLGQEERQWLGTAVVIVASFFVPAIAVAYQAAFIMAAGAVSGAIATQSWQGALWGATSAVVFYGIGSTFQKLAGPPGSGFVGSGLSGAQFAGKALAHGITGGIMSVVQGGKFGHGFAAAGVTQLFSPMIDTIGGSSSASAAGRVAVAALVGGTASVLSGGKFANGAVTAALARAFNHESGHSASVRKFTEDNIELFYSEEVIKNGSQSLATRILVPGSLEYENALAGLAAGERANVASRLNDFNAKLTTAEEISVFNGIKHVGIELNDSLRISGKTFGGYADYNTKTIGISRYMYFSKSQMRQGNIIAHEFRHLMRDNYNYLIRPVKGITNEDDANIYANKYYPFP